MTKTVNNITSYYVWAGGLLMARFTPARGETIAWHYDQAGTMLGFELNGTPYFYVRNLQGDVVAVLDSDGIIVAEYEYDAWGNHFYIMDSEIARINPIRYRGYYWDNATQLYYLQSRYYCPGLRRFISADVYIDTGQGAVGTNMYVYCINNPINLIDPEGTLALTITLVTVLTAITIGKGTVLGGSIGNGIANYYDLEGASRIAVIAGGALVGGGATAAVAIGGPAVIAAAAPVVAQQKDNIVNLAAKIGIRSAAAANRAAGFESLGSTGRTIAQNLTEQLAMEQVMSSPLTGATELTRVVMTDPRWLASEGWAKFAQNVNGVEIHFLFNSILNVFDDFKFV